MATDKPVTKAEARSDLQHMGLLLRLARKQIDEGNALELRTTLGDLSGWAAQLQTDIFDADNGRGLRGVCEPDEPRY